MTQQFFSGLNTASASGGGVYFTQGIYPRVRIDGVKTITGRKGDFFFIVNCEIIESEVPGRPEGMYCDWTVNMRHDASMGNIKSFLDILFASYEELRAFFKDEHKGNYETFISDALERKLLDDLELKLEAVNIKTKAGGDFTLHRWHCC